MKIAYGRSSWIKILSTFQTFSGKIFRCKTLPWSFVRLSSLPFLSTLDGSTRWICRDGGGFARSRFYYRKSARWYKQHPSRRVVNRTDHACTARGYPHVDTSFHVWDDFSDQEDGLWAVTFLSNRPPPLLSLLLTWRSTLARSNVTPSPSKLDLIY